MSGEHFSEERAKALNARYARLTLEVEETDERIELLSPQRRELLRVHQWKTLRNAVHMMAGFSEALQGTIASKRPEWRMRGQAQASRLEERLDAVEADAKAFRCVVLTIEGGAVGIEAFTTHVVDLLEGAARWEAIAGHAEVGAHDLALQVVEILRRVRDRAIARIAEMRDGTLTPLGGLLESIEDRRRVTDVLGQAVDVLLVPRLGKKIGPFVTDPELRDDALKAASTRVQIPSPSLGRELFQVPESAPGVITVAGVRWWWDDADLRRERRDAKAYAKRWKPEEKEALLEEIASHRGPLAAARLPDVSAVVTSLRRPGERGLREAQREDKLTYAGPGRAAVTLLGSAGMVAASVAATVNGAPGGAWWIVGAVLVGLPLAALFGLVKQPFAGNEPGLLDRFEERRRVLDALTLVEDDSGINVSVVAKHAGEAAVWLEDFTSVVARARATGDELASLPDGDVGSRDRFAEIEAWCSWVDALARRDTSLAREAEDRLMGRRLR